MNSIYGEFGYDVAQIEKMVNGAIIPKSFAILTIVKYGLDNDLIYPVDPTIITESQNIIQMKKEALQGWVNLNIENNKGTAFELIVTPYFDHLLKEVLNGDNHELFSTLISSIEQELDQLTDYYLQTGGYEELMKTIGDELVNLLDIEEPEYGSQYNMLLHSLNFSNHLNAMKIDNSTPVLLGSFTSMTSSTFLSINKTEDSEEYTPTVIDPNTNLIVPDSIKRNSKLLTSIEELDDESASSIQIDHLFTYIFNDRFPIVLKEYSKEADINYESLDANERNEVNKKVFFRILPELKPLLIEINRVLKKGGRIVMMEVDYLADWINIELTDLELEDCISNEENEDGIDEDSAFYYERFDDALAFLDKLESIKTSEGTRDQVVEKIITEELNSGKVGIREHSKMVVFDKPLDYGEEKVHS